MTYTAPKSVILLLFYYQG